MFEPVTKMSVEVDQVRLLPNLLRQAFRTATPGPPGPVHSRMRGRHGNVLEEEAALDLTFEAQFSCYPAFRPEADMKDLNPTIEALLQAARCSFAMLLRCTRAMNAKSTPCATYLDIA